MWILLGFLVGIVLGLAAGAKYQQTVFETEKKLEEETAALIETAKRRYKARKAKDVTPSDLGS